LNKAELIEGLTARLGDKKVATTALEGFIDIVERAVAKGEKVSITGFGSFEKVDRPARTARNPMTGATVKVKKTSVPKFRPGSALKQVANGTTKKGREPKHEPLLPQGVLRIVASAQSETSAAAPAARKATTSRAAATKTAATKTAAKKAPATKTAATKTAAKKAPATKTAATKTAATKTAAKKAPATKTAATKTAAKKAPATKVTASKTAAKKTPAAKATATKTTATKATATKTAAKKAPATKTAAKRAPAKKAAAK
jgi:DNA-binding protein HU-beta